MYEYEVVYIVGYDRSHDEVLDTFITFAHSPAEAVENFIWSEHGDESIIVNVINYGYID